ncbi:hypothetical protein BGX33_000752 [Mortierella sp. NVP41]|nr:hypothetical protein BGX33_000752 [Mortierella sp. NVP41]
MVPPPAAAMDPRPLGINESDTEDKERTPRPHNQTIGTKSSTETLKAKKKSKPTSGPITITFTSASAATSHADLSSQTSPTSPISPSTTTAVSSPQQGGVGHKFSLTRKKKRLQREEEEREEQRLKEEAAEAIRRKHGEYHPPGHSQGLIHTHRIPQQHDHHHLERSRSANNMRQQHQQQQRSVSSSRVASPTPRSASRASTQSSASSSMYSGSRNGSYVHHNGNNSVYYGHGHHGGRPFSPMGEIVSMPADYFHTHPHMNALEGLDAGSMLSEHWDSNSDHEEEDLSHYTNRSGGALNGGGGGALGDDVRDPDGRQRKASLETSSSYRTNESSSMVWVPQRPLSPSSMTSSRNSRSKNHHHPHQQSTMSSISQQMRPDDPRLSNDHNHRRTRHVSLEMQEANDGSGSGKLNHQSWPLNNMNMSTTGIVTGLSPEFDGHGEDIQRPHSSMSRYKSKGHRYGHSSSSSKYRDPRVERYHYHARSSSPTNSNVHSSTSNHRPRHYHHHHKNSSQHLNFNDHHHHDGSDNNTRKTSSEMASSATAVASAAEALRAKAGSRATNYNNSRPHQHGHHRSSKTLAGGNADTWSVHDHETVVSTDEHNYLAPLPPFQQGPAYTRVPKRKFCKWFFGGCRWWVLLLVILVPAGLIAVATAFLLHWFRVCIAIDPTTVEPMVYMIDPATVQGISLDYQTRTKGTINIVDSPSMNETRVIMKLRRQFYNMKGRQDLTGFKVSTLENGFSRYLMDDEANNHKEFFISSVLCSDSILTIEMPRTQPGSPEIGLDILLDQQDVIINLDQSLQRNATWKFKGVSNRNMVVQSLNINALTISYTSTSPSSVDLQSVIVRDQLAVMAVSGSINATVGFGVPITGNPTTSGTAGLTPTTVNLNTLDGEIRLDLEAWNQSCIFQIDSPDIQLSKARAVILPFGGSHNRTDVNVSGLSATEGQHSLTGSYRPQGAAPPLLPPPPPGAGTATTVLSTSTTVTSTTTAATPSATALAPGSGTGPGRPALGAGGSSVPAQLMIQANKNVAINFP